MSSFKIDWGTYEELKKEGDPDFPVNNDKKNDWKVIKWVFTFTDSLSPTYASRGPFVYVLQESSGVPSEVGDPLDTYSYHVTSGSIHEGLLDRLSHNRLIYKDNNT